MKLNIGCGNKKIEGYVGVDKFQCDAADYICDIENEKLVSLNNLIQNNLLNSLMNSLNTETDKELAIIPTKFGGLGLPDPFIMNKLNNFTSKSVLPKLFNQF